MEIFTLEQAEDHIGDLRGLLDRLGEVLPADDTDLVPVTPTAGNAQYSAGGHQKYISSDGSAYNTGRNSVGGVFTSLSGSFQTIVSLPLGVGTYIVRGQMIETFTVSGGVLSWQWAAGAGLTQSDMRISTVELNGTSVGLADFNAALGSVLTGSTVGAGLAPRIIHADGQITVSAAGNLNWQARLSAGSGSALATGTYLEALPIT